MSRIGGTRLPTSTTRLGATTAGSVALVDRSGKRRNLSESFETAQGLAWSPEGGEVWFTAAKSGSNRAVYAVTLSGKERLLSRVPGTLTLHDVSGGGRVVMTRDINRQEALGRSAGDQKERDLSWLDWTNSTDISADGKTFLFSEAGEGGGAGYSVYVRGMDGSPAVRLGEGSSQALSPDGKWALAITKVASEPQVVLYPTGAGETRTLPREGLLTQTAHWLPDGKQILLTASEAGHGSRLYLRDLSGGKPRAISPEGYRSFPRTVSPDGKFVAARGPDQRLYLYPVAGGEPSPIPGLTPEDIQLRGAPTAVSSTSIGAGSCPQKCTGWKLRPGGRSPGESSCLSTPRASSLYRRPKSRRTADPTRTATSARSPTSTWWRDSSRFWILDFGFWIGGRPDQFSVHDRPRARSASRNRVEAAGSAASISGGRTPGSRYSPRASIAAMTMQGNPVVLAIDVIPVSRLVRSRSSNE